MHAYDLESGDRDRFGLGDLADESDDDGSGNKRTSFDENARVNGGGLNGVPNGHSGPRRMTIEFENVKPNKSAR